MLKKRIVACLNVKNGWVVQSIGFRSYLPVGRLSVSVDFLNRWGIDEIVILDLDATRENRRPNFELVTEISKKNFVPLTVGGGIKSVDDARLLIHSGADKIATNSAALENPAVIEEASKVFGVQCIVVSIDVRNLKGKYEVVADSGKRSTGKDPLQWAKEIEERGAGEILLNSVDRDGSKEGYDLDLINRVVEAVQIPVIACGGVGRLAHFHEGATKTNASALAAGNFFHFTEQSPILVKSYLERKGVALRFDSYAHYREIDFDEELGRINKKSDQTLYKLRFTYQPEEVI